MHRRTWIIFITVNVIVSAIVMLTILFTWERIRNSSTPTPTFDPALLATRAASDPILSPMSSPNPPPPPQYTVQEGDTLGAIAHTYDVSVEDLMAVNGITDPNLLRIGQTLAIPSNTPAPSSTDPSVEIPPEPSTAGTFPTPLPTLTPSGPPQVEIGQVIGAGDLTTEVIVVRNMGGLVSLEEWTLSDAEGNIFTFPTISLFANVQMRVHSVPGRSTPSDLYWGREIPAWNTGELITLRDEVENVIDTHIVP
ncbi:MAG: LysM peptidoglycan-binding domain-containing protein [Chloroflexi bacterium]|nr:LysM peptidoglycan-binding domain-containing protein [Chloroflexota bacterium]